MQGFVLTADAFYSLLKTHEYTNNTCTKILPNLDTNSETKSWRGKEMEYLTFLSQFTNSSLLPFPNLARTT